MHICVLATKWIRTMRQVLIDREWYDAVSSASVYEEEYEALLLQNAAALYPGFHLVVFKKQVHSDYGTTAPDLALIDTEYRKWWTVEVELAHHNLQGHVMPQVEKLSVADYGDDSVEYLLSKAPILDATRLAEMVCCQPPQVLVVVNAPRPQWVVALRHFDAAVQVVQVYRSRLNKEAFVVDGANPRLPDDLVSVCVRDRTFPQWLVVKSPGRLPVEDGETVVLEFGDGSAEWRRMRLADVTYLVPRGRCTLPIDAGQYELVQEPSGRLSLATRRR